MEGRRPKRSGRKLSAFGFGILLLALASLFWADSWPKVFPAQAAETNTETPKDKSIQGGKGAYPIKSMTLHPVGRVVRTDDRVFLEIFPEFAPALDGISGFSHIWVFFWFHGNDTPENRSILKVHPRKDPANPLTGVFATRAPVRPNLIGLTSCRLLKVEGTRLEVDNLDAWPDSPVLDLKPYLPPGDAHPEATTPAWVKRRRGQKNDGS